VKKEKQIDEHGRGEGCLDEGIENRGHIVVGHKSQIDSGPKFSLLNLLPLATFRLPLSSPVCRS